MLNAQRGLSLVGLIFMLFILGMIGLLGAKILPTFIEYRAIKNSIATAKATGGSVREIQTSFDKGAEINNVTAITGKDLMISKETGELEISFAYEQRIPLFGPATLLINYEGTTAKTMPASTKAAP
jgi:hypothetical protein